jgi:hypothetical protein
VRQAPARRCLAECVQRIKFDAAGLAGDDATRKDQWIASLSASYARLDADPAPHRPFRGELRTALAGDVSVGTVQGTVKTIARTAADIAAHNTDNLVLLCNAGTSSGASRLGCVPGPSATCCRCRRRGGASAPAWRARRSLDAPARCFVGGDGTGASYAAVLLDESRMAAR